MRFSLLFLSTFFLTSSVLAALPTVKITSFVYSGPETRLAEVCGTVTDNKTTPTYVRVLVDQNSDHPGTYNTLVGPDGKFCLAVITYRKTAVATIWE